MRDCDCIIYLVGFVQRRDTASFVIVNFISIFVLLPCPPHHNPGLLESPSHQEWSRQWAGWGWGALS